MVNRKDERRTFDVRCSACLMLDVHISKLALPHFLRSEINSFELITLSSGYSGFLR
jgi:hypothetical protein